MNAVSFDCCGGCVPLSPGQSVQDVIGIHRLSCGICDQLSQLAAVRDEEYRDVAICGDLDAARMNRISGWPNANFPIEISGDAIATYNHKHEEKDAS